MKNIVYIIGAGATQAEANYAGMQINMLMKNNELGPGISKSVLTEVSKSRKRIKKLFDIEEETDIEKLISLLMGTGDKDNITYAETFRKHYYLEITDRLHEAGVMHNPQLAIGLLQMHNNSKFSGIENFLGIISLNHDNLFQEAWQTVYSSINLGFEFSSDDFKCESSPPLLIQLHGSFSWRRERCIRVVKLKPEIPYDPAMIWIPPSILKETKDYPFNKLTGLAYELLSACDILRIVGCSLSQNDWNLISLIFNAQNAQFNDSETCFKIELLMDVKNVDSFIRDISYLSNVTPIHQLKDGDFSDYEIASEDRSKPSDLDNPFEYWLKTKVKYHISEGQIDESNLGSSLKEIIGN